jgi:hypothetical protein
MFLKTYAEEDGGVEQSRAIARRADDVVRRCSAGLRGTEFQVEVVRALHALLPVDAVFLATADPGTLLLTGIFAEQPLINVADQFLDNEFGHDDVNKFQSLVTGARHVATWIRRLMVSVRAAPGIATSWRRSVLAMSCAPR